MRPARHYFIAGLLLACGTGCAAIAAAAGISISPVVIEIDSPRRAVAVTVTNNGDSPVTFQTEAVTWQYIDGRDRYEPTDELLIVPPIVEVPPNASQIFRVMLRARTASPVERAYRLILEDITEERTPTGDASIAFKLNHSLPVMIAPSAKVVNAVRWKPCATDAATSPAPTLTRLSPASGAAVSGSTEVCVTLRNAGNRRIKVQTLTLAGDGWQQALPLKEGQNVFAGAEREIRVLLQSGQAGALRAVQVQTARGETLQAESGNF